MMLRGQVGDVAAKGKAHEPNALSVNHNPAHPEEPLSLSKWRLEGPVRGSRRAFALRQAQETQPLLTMSGSDFQRGALETLTQPPAWLRPWKRVLHFKGIAHGR